MEFSDDEWTDERYERNAALYAQSLLIEGKTLEELKIEREEKVERMQDTGIAARTGLKAMTRRYQL